MPIQINQKFPRCQLCGKIIPLRAERVDLVVANQPVIRFCSAWCLAEYSHRYAAAIIPIGKES